jgi:hypothetical protein
MTCDEDRFLTLRKEIDGLVSFGNNDSTIIIGRGTNIIGNKDTKEENVLLVEDMKHNILSVRKMCEKGQKPMFDSKKCKIIKQSSGILVGIVIRTSRSIYVLSENGNEKCCLGNEDEVWL